MLKRSPLAPANFPEMPVIAGVELASVAAGIRYCDRTDLLLMKLAPGTQVAGVFTRSLTAGAPVLWCRKALERPQGRAIVVNSGNANAFTGRRGAKAVETTVSAISEALECPAEEVFVASTGVIGEVLPADKLVAAVPQLQNGLVSDGWFEAAKTIMTTDTYPKGASIKLRLKGTEVTINGIAKGSGMIQPDMATTLAFVATDAKLSQEVLQALLQQATDHSFNAITVDGDTSTSDTLLLAATGHAGNEEITDLSDPDLQDFAFALEDLLVDLAQQVVRDGEGAQKFVTIGVEGAESEAAARRIGLAIANSPLVKTAIAGEDPNWGRIVMAVGKSGERADPDRLAISIGGVAITIEGEVRPDYDEAPVAAHMKGQDIMIVVNVGVGEAKATVWTCDLTHAYIDINADYRS